MFTFFVKKLYRSIAFLPTLICLAFVSVATLQLVFAESMEINAGSLAFLQILEEDTVHTILSTVIGGVFTLTIFSYTMVMNVLNRSISNYSPRLLPVLLEERHHQVVLGFTAGTIIHSLILFLGVTNAESATDVPPFGAALSIIFAITCLGFFIYFIHRISQSIHINYLLRNSFLRGEKLLKRQLDTVDWMHSAVPVPEFSYVYRSETTGYLLDYQWEALAEIGRKQSYELRLERIPGLFVQRGENLFSCTAELPPKLESEVRRAIRIAYDEPIVIYTTSMKHLTEVALKACSPAINDIGTALTAIDYLTALFLLRCRIPPYDYLEKNGGRVFVKHFTFEQLLRLHFVEMSVYMKNDPLLTEKLLSALTKIADCCRHHEQADYANTTQALRRELSASLSPSLALNLV